MKDIRSEVDWDLVKTEMMEKYPVLIEDDFQEEKEDKLLMHLGEKIGESPKETRFIMKNL